MSSTPPGRSDPPSPPTDPTTPRFDREEDAEEYERLRQEMFAVWGRLARSGVDVNILRQSVLLGQVLTPSQEVRDDFDRVRLELDAYLRSIVDGEAAVKPTDDFVPSPEISAETVEQLIAALLGAVPGKNDGTTH